LVYGKYTLLDANNPSIYAYTREWEGKKLLILLNFTNKKAKISTGLDLGKAKVIVSNYTNALVSEVLRGYEAVILEL
jgi:oligo-1,6-glucosidase